MTASPQRKDNIIHIPYDVDINLDKALSEYVFEALTENCEKIAQVDSSTGRTETFGQLLKRSINLAQSLKGKGVTTNDIVALYCYNNMDYIVVMIASIFIGARFCAFDITAPNSSTIHCLKLANPVLIFCDQESEDILSTSIEKSGIKCEIITFDNSNKFITMERLMETFKNGKEFKVNTSRKLSDSGCVTFTSGTSGLSKGAELRNFGLLYGAMNGLKLCPIDEKSMITTVPYWVSNIGYCMLSLLFGTERIVYRTFDVRNVAKMIQDFKVNSMVFTQHLMNDVVKNAAIFAKYDTSSLKYVFCGGSKIGINQFAELQKLLPHTKIKNGFGMTEAAGLMFEPNQELIIDKNENISVGNPLPGFYYKIVDIKTGEALGPHTRGELRIKYAGLMNGYLNQPEKTKEAFDEDGYFRTGDIAYYDDNYNYFIVDRFKEIFKFRGFHISPSIIEDILLLHPHVKECAVIPVPHEHDGELPMAVVTLMDNTKLSKEDIIQLIQDRLADPYHLRGGAFFIDSIPKTSSGKIRRKYLTDLILGK